MVEVDTLYIRLTYYIPRLLDLNSNIRGWDGMGEMGKFPWGIFLMGGGNLRRSNFDHSNFF